MQTSFKVKKEMLLNWFLGGNHIDICTQHGPSYGKVSLSTPLPVSNHIEVLNRLIRDGSVTFYTFYDYGIRWDRIEPSKGYSHEKH